MFRWGRQPPRRRPARPGNDRPFSGAHCGPASGHSSEPARRRARRRTATDDHQLVAVPEGDHDQTPAQLRTEIEALYAHHFRPVTAVALVARQFDLPAGASPMLLTFDDSTTSQYAELPDGTVKPDCAVGILLAVPMKYGDDHPVARFYVNAPHLAGKDANLAKLHALGMELGSTRRNMPTSGSSTAPASSASSPRASR